MRRVKDSQLVSKRKKDRWSLVGGGYKAKNSVGDYRSGLSAVETKEGHSALLRQRHESQHVFPRLTIKEA